MNFENEEERNEAAKKLANVSEVTTKKVRKLNPKIIICIEKSEGRITENLVIGMITYTTSLLCKRRWNYPSDTPGTR